MGQTDYPSDWNSRRKDVYRRDGYACQNCGRSGGSQGHAELHAHHIVPKSKGGSHSKTNLVTVCKQCHTAIHGNSDAPMKGGSAPGRSSGNYFDQSQAIAENIDTFQENIVQYINRLGKVFDGHPEILFQLEDTEQTLRKQAFQIKAEIARFDTENAPSKVTDAYIEDAKTFFDEVRDLFDDVVKLVDLAPEVREELATEAELSCPDCGAGIEPDASFCSSCGADLPAMDSCPECGADVDISDGFCSDCGAELPDIDEEITDNDGERLGAEFTNLADAIMARNQVIGAMANGLVAQCGDILPSSATERVEWRYCPNCGFRHSVYIPDGGRTAECFLCGASWEKSGIITTSWEMTAGERCGEKKSGADWEGIGRRKNDAEEYISHVEDFGAEDRRRVQQRFLV